MMPNRHRLPVRNIFRCEFGILIFCMILTFVTTHTESDVMNCGNEMSSISFIDKNNRDRHLRQRFRFGMHALHGYQGEAENYPLSNLVVIEVRVGEFEDVINSAKNMGFQLIGKVFKDEDLYLLRRQKEGRRVRRTLKNLVLNLYSDPRIKSVAPQYGVKHHRRYSDSESFRIHQQETEEFADWNTLRPNNWKMDSEHRYTSVRFNDPLYKDQWYLVNRNETNGRLVPVCHDINVLPVWRAGINGSRVRISVLDDGVHMHNPEVTKNFNPLLSFDFINLKRLRPEDVPENSHGTHCAAIAAGVANNRYCGVGVAYGAQIGGPRVLDALITDAQEAMALTQALDSVDIYTASWGPKDNGKELAGPGLLTQMALKKGVTQGRQGLGAIYVWAAGNGGVNHDNCNADGYASSIYTLTFGAVTDTGRSTYYSEPCAAVIASTYIGGSHIPPTVENIEQLKKKIKVVVPEAHGKCRETFQGTSAAAPMASGVIALVLQANPTLSWRDVQHIIIACSRIPSWLEPGWSINAAGKHYHLKIGFGVLDAARMVAVAGNWTSVKPLKSWSLQALDKPRRIKAGHTNTISLRVSEERVDDRSNIRCLENVVATVNITHPRRRDLELFLISPAGTVSQILTRRLHDEATHIFMWNFTTLHFWGETPFGEWRLQIMDAATSLCRGFISYFSLTFLGTSSFCLSQMKPIRNLNMKQLISLMKEEENLAESIKLKYL